MTSLSPFLQILADLSLPWSLSLSPLSPSTFFLIGKAMERIVV